MDVGLALRGEAEVTLTLDGQVLGTPAYVAPEQAVLAMRNAISRVNPKRHTTDIARRFAISRSAHTGHTAILPPSHRW
jgi:hypothetical protein